MWRSCPQEEETDTYMDEIRIDGALLPCAHATFGGDADMSDMRCGRDSLITSTTKGDGL